MFPNAFKVHTLTFTTAQHILKTPISTTTCFLNLCHVRLTDHEDSKTIGILKFIENFFSKSENGFCVLM